ncbi:hypothetical protein Mvan_1086 [Mycolicibacterium vanbaalenii PYR-1]|uniref:Uncharacterized protein n=1 Tax=Mycolicibacterium vanbaalenii (strain DSM 7251 / JCM 13017 / BCRC 16820 / KCTC 9966 / NRRL B-24157 / PYR-1) TaxID=350058 RepID=A1T423_MYCVP|nr:hypothetical protein Mvan_1086 [Mycolicibacterium vanbaalenii PYR-1]
MSTTRVCGVPELSSRHTPCDNLPGVDVGLYESVLTERLNSALAQSAGLHAEYGTEDDAEQALVLARHLGPLIERQLSVARGAEERANLGAGGRRQALSG